MTAMIDTLKFAKNFEIAGFAKPQAEALTAAMAGMTSQSREDLVTKKDLNSAISELKIEFRGHIRVAVAGVRTEIITATNAVKWQILWMLFGSQVFVIVAVVNLSNFSKFFN